jgi:hypothetical protein
MDDLGELAGIDGLKVFIASFELFEGLHGGLSHALMGLGRAADEHELFSGGDAFVAIGVVQAYAE